MFAEVFGLGHRDRAHGWAGLLLCGDGEGMARGSGEPWAVMMRGKARQEAWVPNIASTFRLHLFTGGH